MRLIHEGGEMRMSCLLTLVHHNLALEKNGNQAGQDDRGYSHSDYFITYVHYAEI